MKKIIGLIGVKRSGKDTVANLIKEVVPSAKTQALANKLKKACSRILKLDIKLFEDQLLKEKKFDKPIELNETQIIEFFKEFNASFDKATLNEVFNSFKGVLLDTPRKILIVVGTDLLRKYIHEDVHCQFIELDKDSLNIITDIRFKNEYEYFKNNNDSQFLPIYIHRQEAEKHIDMKKSSITETNLFTFNHECVILNNNGTLNDTKKQITNILKKIN